MKPIAKITRNSFKLKRLFIALLAISTAYLSSCQKDLLVAPIHPYVLAAKNQLENRKQLVNSSDSIKGIGNYANKIAKWDKAEVGIISLGQAVYVPLEYDKSVKYSPEGSNSTIPLDKLSYLLIYKDLDSNLHTEIVKKLPNKESLLKTNNVNDRNFSGLVAVEDWDGNPLKYYLKQSDGKILRLKLLSTGYGNVIINSAANVGQVCFDSSWQVIWCLDGGTNCPPITLTYNKCFTTTSDTDGTPSSDTGTSTGSTSGVDYGSGGTSSGSWGAVTAPKDFTMEILNDGVFVNNPKPAIKSLDFIECFYDNKSASEYKLTLYVDQPIANRSDELAILTDNNGNSVGIINTGGNLYNVGHAFVGFEKLNSDGTTVRQVIGFYPGGFGFYSKGVLKNNGGDPFDVSYTINVSSSQFYSALGKLAFDGDYRNYVLSGMLGPEFNCTTAAINWFGVSGKSFPSISGKLCENSPGSLGQALRSMPGANLNPGNAPASKGPCY